MISKRASVLTSLMVVLLSFFSILQAQQLGVEQVLDNMESASARLETMTADFVLTKVMALFDEEVKSSGKFYYKEPDKLVMETLEPDKQTLIINGSEVMMYYPEMKQIHKLSIENGKNMEALFIGFGGSVSSIREHFMVDIDKIEPGESDNQLYTLSLVPREGSPAANPSLGLDKILLTVSSDRWHPVSSEIVQKNEDRAIYEYSGRKFNETVSDERFDFVPPQDTEVIVHGTKGN